MCFVTNHFNSTDINDSYSRICGGEAKKIDINKILILHYHRAKSKGYQL